MWDERHGCGERSFEAWDLIADVDKISGVNEWYAICEGSLASLLHEGKTNFLMMKRGVLVQPILVVNKSVINIKYHIISVNC